MSLSELTVVMAEGDDEFSFGVLLAHLPVVSERDSNKILILQSFIKTIILIQPHIKSVWTEVVLLLG